jgi:hypothetical protein
MHHDTSIYLGTEEDSICYDTINDIVDPSIQNSIIKNNYKSIDVKKNTLPTPIKGPSGMSSRMTAIKGRFRDPSNPKT